MYIYFGNIFKMKNTLNNYTCFIGYLYFYYDITRYISNKYSKYEVAEF